VTLHGDERTWDRLAPPGNARSGAISASSARGVSARGVSAREPTHIVHAARALARPTAKA
jgi:hypothetical protein